MCVFCIYILVFLRKILHLVKNPNAQLNPPLNILENMKQSRISPFTTSKLVMALKGILPCHLCFSYCLPTGAKAKTSSYN